MKAVLLPCTPKECCDLMNGNISALVRKRFPRNYQGWIFIYCKFGNKNECLEYADNPDITKEGKWAVTSGYPFANGKVVGRVWCDKVEVILYMHEFTDPSGYEDWDGNWHETGETYYDTHWYVGYQEVQSGLSYDEVHQFLGKKNGYFISVSKIENFDNPRALGEFEMHSKPVLDCDICKWGNYKHCHYECKSNNVRIAPVNYCYIEVD